MSEDARTVQGLSRCSIPEQLEKLNILANKIKEKHYNDNLLLTNNNTRLYELIIIINRLTFLNYLLILNIFLLFIASFL